MIISKKGKEIAKKQFIRLGIGFLIGVLIGTVFALSFGEQAMKVFMYIGRVIGSKIGEDESSLHVFLGIYLNNLEVATTAYGLGILLGIVPWIIVIFNGFVLGLVATVIISQRLLDPVTLILGIVPHGIIEIPAIILAATSGVMLYKGIFHKDVPKEESLEVVYASLKLYAISAVLLLIAAFIEAFITPEIAGT